MDQLAPPVLAQSWDNVGLLVGDRAAPCRRVLLCIDLTPPVMKEAIACKADLVIAYHPPIFKPIKRLLADSPGTESVIHGAVAHAIAVYSPHTALDAAPGGTNDVLAELCGLSHVEPFEFVAASGSQVKIVTFVPPAHLDRVATAMFSAGAGRIGGYEQCSYRLEGQGTFFGTESTNPRLGQRGRLEKVNETRLEMVAPEEKLPEVVTALRNAHPYEEPAFDLYPLHSPPVAGIGRTGILPHGTRLRQLATRLARQTQSRTTMVVGPPERVVRRAAVCVGAAGLLPLEKSRSADCDVIITGEIRHHDALTLLRRDRSAVALGHWESERPVLRPLARRLGRMLPGVRFEISGKDAPPFTRV